MPPEQEALPLATLRHEFEVNERLGVSVPALLTSRSTPCSFSCDDVARANRKHYLCAQVKMNGGQVMLRAICVAEKLRCGNYPTGRAADELRCVSAQRLKTLGSAGLCLGAHASGGQLHVLVAALERAQMDRAQLQDAAVVPMIE